jgi:hypothetical protein
MESLKKHSRTNSKIAFSKIRKSLEAINYDEMM